MHRTIILLAGLICAGADQSASAAQPAGIVPTPVTPSASDHLSHQRYRLYKTQNIWTLLMLDTRTGALWQVQWSIDTLKSARDVFPVNSIPLADTTDDDRFSLTVTDNIWTSILLDTKTGSVWQCQMSEVPQNRGCLPIPTPK